MYARKWLLLLCVLCVDDITLPQLTQEPELLQDVYSTPAIWCLLSTLCVAPWSVYTRGAWAAPGLIWTTGAGAVPGGADITETWAAHGRVYTQGLELHMDVSTLQRPLQHLDLSMPQGPQLHLLDLSGQQKPVLLLDLSTLQRHFAALGNAYTLGTD
jgi:hypothetical protein